MHFPSFMRKNVWAADGTLLTCRQNGQCLGFVYFRSCWASFWAPHVMSNPSKLWKGQQFILTSGHQHCNTMPRQSGVNKDSKCLHAQISYELISSWAIWRSTHLCWKSVLFSERCDSNLFLRSFCQGHWLLFSSSVMWKLEKSASEIQWTFITLRSRHGCHKSWTCTVLLAGARWSEKTCFAAATKK